MDAVICKLRLLLLSLLHPTKTSPGPKSFLRHFSYKEIKRATDGFRNIVANHSHGVIYKATFQDGHIALVKEVRTSNHEKDVFYKEVQLLGRLHHRHLVKLMGFSLGRERFLVFENSERGSLKKHLSDPLKTPLNWKTRLRIANDVAAALEYLSFFCDPPMHHITISSSNIMLDDNFTAKISDVGLLCSAEKHFVEPHLSCSKECIEQASRSMIFQLGLLILELITGQSSEKGGTDLIQWAQEPRYGMTIHKMIDPDLGNNYDSRELKSLLAVARLCVGSGDKPTFSIRQVRQYLQKKLEVPTS